MLEFGFQLDFAVVDCMYTHFHLVWHSALPDLLKHDCCVSQELSVVYPKVIICMPSLLVKGKAILVQAWAGPKGSRRLSSQISRHSAYEGGKVVTQHNSRPYPQEIFLVLISVRV
jgi:hypothetical protein